MIQLRFRLSRQFSHAEGETYISNVLQFEDTTWSDWIYDDVIITTPEETAGWVRQVMNAVFDEV